MKKIGIFALIPFILFLSGCWDQLELEEQAYVVVVGVDKSEQQNAIDVTFQIANPQVGSTDQSQAEKEPASQIITLTVPDIISAKDTANAIITRQVTFSHLQSFIISRELAETEEFQNIVSSVTRDRQIRREVSLIVTEEKASDFISQNDPKLETRPHKYYELMKRRWEHKGMVPYSTFDNYFEQSEGKNAPFLAIYATSKRKDNKYGEEDDYVAGQVNTKGGNPVQMIGAAVIQGGKMIDVLTGEETRLAMLMRRVSQADSWLTTYKDPLDKKHRLTTRIIKEKSTIIDVKTDTEPLTINVNVPVTIQLQSIPSQIDYVKDQKNQELLQSYIEEVLNEKASELVKKTQEKYHDDVFLWHLEARKNFWKTEAFYKYDWNEKYKNAHVNIQFNVTLKDFGKQLRPPKAISEEQ